MDKEDKIVEKELSYILGGIFFEVQDELGRHSRERQYGDLLEQKLEENNIKFQREYPIEVAGRKSNFVDFVIKDRVLVDLKAKPFIEKEDYHQMKRYLKTSGLKIGLIINFKDKYLKAKRILNSEVEEGATLNPSLDSQKFAGLHRSRGFTLIELIVVITIFAALTSVVLFNFSGFDESIKLQNLSQQIALQIKRAQTAGSQGQIPVVSTVFGWKPTYGVHFDIIQSDTMFTYFVDNDLNLIDGEGNKLYDGRILSFCGVQGADTDCLAEISIATGQTIERLCVNKLTNNLDNPDDLTSCQESVDNLHITYTRPSLEANIAVKSGGNITYASFDPGFSVTLIENAQIIIRSPKDQRRMITVWPIGQIAVE